MIEEKIKEIWEAYDNADEQEKANLTNHSFKMEIYDVGYGWEYVWYTVDDGEKNYCRISYIGPTVKGFACFVLELEPGETDIFTWEDEPGAYPWQLSRKGKVLYVKAPHMDDGFFISYDAFCNEVVTECVRVYDYDFLENIAYIPDGTTDIYERDFSLNEDLTVIRIPESVNYIEHGAFQGCKNVRHIDLPEGITEIGRYTFHDCHSLTTFVVPKNVTRIEKGACEECINLTSIIVPDSVTEIEEDVFKRSPKVTVICGENSPMHKYCMENNVTYIFDYQYEAFHGVMPENVEMLSSPFLADEEKPFVFISYSHKDRDEILPIIEILYEAGWKIWYDEGLTIGDKYDETLEEHVRNCSAFLLFITENSQNSLYVRENEIPWAIRYEKPIIKCVLSEGLDIETDGGDVRDVVSEFRIKFALEEIEGLTKGEPRTAKGISVVFNPADREVESDDKFAYCLYDNANKAKAQSIILDARNGGCRIKDTDEDRERLIRDCACLIVFIDKAFLANPELTRILLREFENKKDLAICQIEELEEKDIPGMLFELYRMQWLNFAYGVTKDMNAKLARHLQERGCRDTDVLPGFEYEKTDEGIILKKYTGMEAFLKVEAEYGGIPVVKIAEEAFDSCARLKIIAVAEGVREIGNYAFHACKNLEIAKLPGSIKGINLGVFSGCSNLTNVSLENGIEYIYNYAFKDCTALDGITIPSTVTEIGDYAFEDCENLRTVNLPDGLKKIGWYAFQNCTNLHNFIIPEGVEDIGTAAFNNCSALEKLQVPDSVTNIELYAFDNCPKLTVICSEGSLAWNYCKENNIPAKTKWFD